MRSITAFLVLGVLGASLAGCADVDDRAAAAETAAVRFTAALAEPGTGGACDALAPATREELEQEGPCPQALASLGLDPDVGRVVGADVYGSQARVVFERDNVFLASFPEGWKVTAAGCTPRQGRPAQCEVKGD
ncbi:hypothetical protein J7E93_30385 [Streptomyces sp. ISL-36]|uniref:hypothetical protein n=1 Tax=Streptomyces sp. ISL-36 TaxID=2819182 RepID=UPI001BEB56FB|nr:hypothetical protein [Streptomyces sp. ISL-36]MBT2444327.1 hypothetical protein [Streptomyces sp. ISL-36]